MMKKLIHDPLSLSDEIVSISKSLRLHTFERYKEYIKNDMSTEEILYQLLKSEQYIKEEHKYKYLIKNAGFPVIKTLDTFEFDPKSLPDLNKDVVMELATCKFVENKRNLVALLIAGLAKVTF